MAKNSDQMTMFDELDPALPLFSGDEEQVAQDDEEFDPDFAPNEWDFIGHEYNAEKFHEWLVEKLALLQQQTENPWDPDQARFYRFCFVERCKWLPKEIGQPIRDAFENEWDRLDIIISKLDQPSEYYADQPEELARIAELKTA